MKSIERHLVARLLGTVLGLSAAAGAGVYFYARARLTRAFDRALVAEAGRVAGMVMSDGPGRLEMNAAAGDLAEFGAGRRHAGYFEIWTAAGRAFQRSPSLGNRDLPRDAPSVRPAAHGLVLPDGRAGRAVTLQFMPRIDEDEPTPGQSPRQTASFVPSGPLALTLALNRRELDETLGVLATSLLLAAAALAFGTVFAVLLTVRRGLRPLRGLGDLADAMNAGSLDRRFPADGLPAELRPITSQLNRLLARLGEAFARERRFTADVAHELRTPIAELRASVEVALRWPDAPALDGACRDALQIAGHMESIVNALLAIARCESDALPKGPPVDLCLAVREAWRSHESSCARSVDAHLDLPESAMVCAHRSILVSLIDNVLSNAFSYTPEGGTIECAVRAAGESVALMVSNTCATLTAADLPHLFEPFWRKDPARSPGAHCGLGLSLVAAYGRALGAEPTVQLTPGGRFCFAMTFPGAALPSPARPALVAAR